MNNKVSIIIPARSEVYLQQTIESILLAAEGDIEVIAILDGYWPEPCIPDDTRVTLIHHSEPIGQRAAVNEGARIATGKYILKTDGHSMFDQGFDLKLKADCEYDWTVIPTMYNLDAGKWEPKPDKKTDFMYIRSPRIKDRPLRVFYLNDKETAREYPEAYKAFKKASWRRGDICDVMTGQGACFFMHRERFWELGGMDEAHGSWGQMGAEVALKAWLSGGSLKVNKKTWFAHMFRKEIPYKMSGRDQQRARDYSIDFWTNGKWPLQKRPLSWLVDKFAPVPTWKEKEVKKPARRQHSYIGSHIFDMRELIDNRLDYADPRKVESCKEFLRVFPPFIERVALGETFTDEALEVTSYYAYMISKLNPVDRDPLTSKGKRHALNLIKREIKIFYDIRDFGLKAPLDMWREGPEKFVLNRGGRRVEMLKVLDRKTVPVRIFKTKEIFRTHNSPVISSNDFGAGDDNSIHNLAVKQFMKLEHKATDKYWVHGYTRLYDKHIGHLRKEALKILEIGVFRGASLLLWKEAYPKSKIYGIDKNWKISRPFLEGQDRIEVFQGRQEDVKFLKEKVVPSGPFDIIIDDGGHKPGQQQPSFEVLWKNLKSGGWYIIEDLFGNYRESVMAQAKRQGLESTMDYLKNKIDEAQNGFEIKSMTFYYNICFIEKA